MEEETTFEQQEHSFGQPSAEQNHCNSSKPQDRRSATAILQQKETSRNTKAARTTVMIVFAFAFCWLPFTVLSMTLNVCKFNCFFKFSYQVSDIFLSTINPIIYSFCTQRFKKAFKRMIENKCKIRKNRKGKGNLYPSVLSFANSVVTLTSFNGRLEVPVAR